MGVEYKHFLIPADPTFVPKSNIISKLDQLLAKWSLKTGDPQIFNLTNGENTLVHEDFNSIEIGHGLALEYPGIEGKQVREIVGPSYYEEISDNDRYIERITFILGSDYRVHPSNEEICMTVTNPPLEGSTPLEPYCEFDEFLHYGLHAEAYNCSINANPPKIDISVTDKNRIIGEQNFLGFWRTALILDFGKDLPKLSQLFFKLENDTFTNELEQVFESRLIQIGEVY